MESLVSLHAPLASQKRQRLAKTQLAVYTLKKGEDAMILFRHILLSALLGGFLTLNFNLGFALAEQSEDTTSNNEGGEMHSFQMGEASDEDQNLTPEEKELKEFAEKMNRIQRTSRILKQTKSLENVKKVAQVTTVRTRPNVIKIVPTDNSVSRITKAVKVR
jgi:hypothetical protein